MDRNLLIMAAGTSSRMKTSAESEGFDQLAMEARSKPKMMLGVGANSRPFLDYLLMNASDAGYRDVVFIVNDQDDSVRNYYMTHQGDNVFSELEFHFAIQSIPDGRTKPLGTADAVLAGLDARPDWAGQKFTVCNSDNLYSISALRLLLQDRHGAALIDYDRTSLGFEPTRVNAFAVIWKNDKGFLTDIVEKPNEDQVVRATDHNGRVGVSMNIFRLTYDTIVPLLRRTPLHPDRNEQELTETVRMLVRKQSDAMFALPMAETVPDLTTLKDLPSVRAFIRSRR